MVIKRLRKILSISVIGVLLFINSINASTLSKEALKNSNVFKDNSGGLLFYENQLTSSYRPYTSCVASVGKMVLNIFSNNSENISLESISKGINTNSKGAYMSNLGLYLSNYYNINYNINKFSNNDSENFYIELNKAINNGNLVGLIIQTDKLLEKGYIAKYDTSFNHAILVYGMFSIEEVNFYMIKDPYNNSNTIYINSDDLYDMVLSGWITVFSKSNK